MLACLLILVATPQTADQIEAATQTRNYIESLRDPATGAYKVTAGGRPNLRAVNGAVKAIKMRGGIVTDLDKLRAFVLRCQDPATGAFAEEPGGKTSVSATAVGVIAGVEVGVPRDKLRPAMDFLGANAKGWEEVRIGAAAVEAWGLKDCPFDLKPWFEVARQMVLRDTLGRPPLSRENGIPRWTGSLQAFELRLGRPKPEPSRSGWTLGGSQWAAGGWGTAEGQPCDLESTYRVMRAIHLLGERPSDPAKLREFLTACRNPDGGSAVTAGGPSTMSGTYYAAMIEGWLR